MLTHSMRLIDRESPIRVIYSFHVEIEALEALGCHTPADLVLRRPIKVRVIAMMGALPPELHSSLPRPTPEAA